MVIMILAAREKDHGKRNTHQNHCGGNDDRCGKIAFCGVGIRLIGITGPGDLIFQILIVILRAFQRDGTK